MGLGFGKGLSEAFGRKKSVEEPIEHEPATDFERELEQRLESDLLDEVYSMRDRLAPASQDLTAEDRQMLTELITKTTMSGVNENKLRAFILRGEVSESQAVPAEEIEEENMNITSLEALEVLYEQNITVRSLIEKVRTDEVDYEHLRTQLEMAGYTISEDFEDIVNNFLRGPLPEAA